MLAKVLAGIVLLMGSAAADELPTDTTKMLLAVKSSDGGERRVGVQQLLAMREAVARGLTDLVEKATVGQTDDFPKALSLKLMGELGLVQATPVLARECMWSFQPRTIEEWSWRNGAGRHYVGAIFGRPAAYALDISQCDERLLLRSDRPSADASHFPELLRPLRDLSSDDMRTCLSGSKSLLTWYRKVCQELNDVVTSDMLPRSSPGRITAAYLLGEYRDLGGFVLIRHIDLEDTQEVSAGYPAALEVRPLQPSARYPCVVALRKLGGRTEMPWAFRQLARSNGMPQHFRDMIARTLMEIDPVRARRAYAEEGNALRPVDGTSVTAEERTRLEDQRRALESVGAIMK